MEVLAFATTMLVVLALSALAAAAESRDGFTDIEDIDRGRSIDR